MNHGTHQIRQLFQDLVRGNLVQHGPSLAQLVFETSACQRGLQQMVGRDHQRDACGIGARAEEDGCLVQEALARRQGATFVGLGREKRVIDDRVGRVREFGRIAQNGVDLRR